MFTNTLAKKITNENSKSQFVSFLQNHGIYALYHITPIENLDSIRRYGGLFSWAYLQSHNIPIPCQGGNSLSRSLDLRRGFQDYVRLSFCDAHPMAYRLAHNNNLKLVRLQISTNVITETSYISNLNATDNNATIKQGIEGLELVNYTATKKNDLSKYQNPIQYKEHQAEVLILTHVPSSFITNLDEPDHIDENGNVINDSFCIA